MMVVINDHGADVFGINKIFLPMMLAKFRIIEVGEKIPVDDIDVWDIKVNHTELNNLMFDSACFNQVVESDIVEIPGDPKRQDIIRMIEEELTRANKKFPQFFNSTWEGFGVIYEEFDEMKDEIRKQKAGNYINTPMIKETIQTAAMCIKLLESLPWNPK